jgi:hypothetical protein
MRSKLKVRSGGARGCKTPLRLPRCGVWTKMVYCSSTAAYFRLNVTFPTGALAATYLLSGSGTSAAAFPPFRSMSTSCNRGKMPGAAADQAGRIFALT